MTPYTLVTNTSKTIDTSKASQQSYDSTGEWEVALNWSTLDTVVP